MRSYLPNPKHNRVRQNPSSDTYQRGASLTASQPARAGEQARLCQKYFVHTPPPSIHPTSLTRARSLSPSIHVPSLRPQAPSPSSSPRAQFLASAAHRDAHALFGPHPRFPAPIFLLLLPIVKRAENRGEGERLGCAAYRLRANRHGVRDKLHNQTCCEYGSQSPPNGLARAKTTADMRCPCSAVRCWQ